MLPRKTVLTLISIVLLSVPLFAENPTGASITSPGQLKEKGWPAEGLFDLKFTLYGDSVNGRQLGSAIVYDKVNIAKGLLTISLDFGAGVFDANSLWIEVAVRDGNLSDPNEYRTFLPRQEIFPAAHALEARKSDSIVEEKEPTDIANVKDGISWSKVSDKPEGLDDGDDVGVVTESDPTVLSTVKDGVSWKELSGVPSALVSRGNFCVYGAGTAFVWCQKTQKWYSNERLGSAIGAASSKGNFCVYEAGAAYVWSEETQKWYSNERLGSAIGVAFSEGNFCVYEAGAAYVWSGETQKWYSDERLGYAKAIAASEGNFCVYEAGAAYVWCRETKKWYPETALGSAIGHISSNGSFCVYEAGAAFVWSEETKKWQSKMISGAIIDAISD